jgi:hypothetical protein
MRKDLLQLKTRVGRNLFGDCSKNLENLSTENKEKQRWKSKAFIEEAITSPDKHHLRQCNELLSAASGGEAPIARIVARILLSHHLPDNPNETNQVNVECFSKDHNRHIDLNDFASSVRENCTRETEKDEATKQLAQIVATGVDVWKEDEEGSLTQNDAATVTVRGDHFCSLHLPLASNSQFVEGGGKEAKIASTTGRNEELRSARAICRSFLFGKLQPTTNTPARVEQTLSVVIDRNAVHVNEITKPARKERRATVKSALLENHFRKERLEKKQASASTKGSEDKADNVTQKLAGADDTAFIGGKTQHGKLRMNERTDNLNAELTFRGLAEFLLLGWTDKLLRNLKEHEHHREPAGEKKCFFAQSEASFTTSKL